MRYVSLSLDGNLEGTLCAAAAWPACGTPCVSIRALAADPDGSDSRRIARCGNKRLEGTS